MKDIDKDASEIFRNLKQDISDYAGLKFEIIKLDTYERIGKVIATLSYGIVLVTLIFFVILFIFLALGFYLGSVFESEGLGFALVTAIYLSMIVLLILNKKWVHSIVLNNIVETMMTKDAMDENLKTEEDGEEAEKTEPDRKTES